MEYDEKKVAIALALIREYLNRSEISDLVKLLNPPPKPITKSSPYRDGDWFESCKPDDHDD